MAKIRVLFGQQIRLNYADPQPMALRGRVAVAEIAPELLIYSTPTSFLCSAQAQQFSGKCITTAVYTSR